MVRSCTQLPGRHAAAAIPAVLLILAGIAPVRAQSAGLEGFLEPYRTIDIAASEPGLLESVLTQEGAVVEAGAVVAEMQNDVLEAALRIAVETSQSQGKLEVAKSELRLSETLLRKLTELQGRSIATPQEVERATVERDVAAARLLTVEEDRAIRALEAERIRQEIDVRRLRSPIAGVVTRQWKDAGEYVAPADPIVLTVVQLDPLTAVFAVPPEALTKLAVGGVVQTVVGDAGVKAEGTVEFISPLIDPRSATGQVKVRIPNPDGALHGGERCLLQIEAKSPPAASPPKVATPVHFAPAN